MKRIIYLIKDFFTYKIKWIKWWFQRAKKGYADCDVWGLDYYLCAILIPALKDLKENAHGFPAELKTFSNWKHELDVMISGFKSAKRISELDYPDMKQWRRDYGRDMKIFKKGMKSFSKHFLGLWD